ncbi:MAG: hypothetical protein CL685_01375 [Candidatus Magasanikbacteria bacterium]|nr:hypothetical protein [Candidatus Magasanikbacteria bacterium]
MEHRCRKSLDKNVYCLNFIIIKLLRLIHKIRGKPILHQYNKKSKVKKKMLFLVTNIAQLI